MARIRSIHPGFWTDEATLDMSLHAQLFLIGLWGEADDGGAFAWQTRQLKARILPERQVDIEALLTELTELNVITYYEVNGVKIGAIRNFGTWQSPRKPSRKLPMPGEIVAFCNTGDVPPFEGKTHTKPSSSWQNQERTASSHVSTHHERVSHIGHTHCTAVPNRFHTCAEPVPLGEERKGEEEETLSHSVRERHAPALKTAQSPEKNTANKQGTRLPHNWHPSKTLIEYATHYNLNPSQVTEDFREYWHAKPGANARKLDWDATFRMWCRREDRQQKDRCVHRGTNITPFPRASASKQARHDSLTRLEEHYAR